LSALLLVACLGFTAEGRAADAAAEQALTAAIGQARDDGARPFHLEVHCADEERIRTLTVYRGRVAVWNRDRQFELDDDTRRAVLTHLLDGDFPALEARYGGKPKAGKQEAALRISCRIFMAVDGQQKTSAQVFFGEQSAALLGLANAILDRVEPLAADGVRASSLEDGLRKLRTGALAPETLSLRLAALPAVRSEEAGYVLRVEAGRLERQVYAPGRHIGEPSVRVMAPCQFEAALDALLQAGVWRFPVNLARELATDLEVGVLGHRAQVVARPDFRPASPDVQASFETLVAALEAQPSNCEAAD
jgi:hypothetical protein